MLKVKYCRTTDLTMKSVTQQSVISPYILMQVKSHSEQNHEHKTQFHQPDFLHRDKQRYGEIYEVKLTLLNLYTEPAL